MKNLLFLLAYLPVVAFTQVVENFESGTMNSWVESTPGRWAVSNGMPLNGNYSLSHIFDNPEAGTDQAGIGIHGLTLSAGTTVWQFRVKHGYNPSSANNWSVFLISDAPPSSMKPGADVNGYAVAVNFTGNDDILKLLRVNDGTASLVINTGINWQESIGSDSAAFIRVERTPAGEWSLMLLDNEGSIRVITNGTDAFLPRITWFGLYYKYSATLDRLLWFDDLLIDGIWLYDTIPPVVESVKPVSGTSLIVTVSEVLNEESLIPTKWMLQPGNHAPASVTLTSSLSLMLEFDSQFLDRQEYSLHTGQLCDIYGNCSSDTVYRFIYTVAQPGDIIVTEIMANPLPVVKLPPHEYIEIHNCTEFTFDIVNWTFSHNSNTVSLPEISIGPGDYMVLCGEEAVSNFSGMCSVAGLKTFPSLADKSAILVLRDSTGRMIHGVEYSEKWHSQPLKKDGGWALEMIDADYPFFAERNWTSSDSRSGGTPGSSNSVAAMNPDNKPVEITNLFPSDSITLNISFNKSVANFLSIARGYSYGGISLSGITISDPLHRTFQVSLQEPLVRGNIYSFRSPSELIDFGNNGPADYIFRFALPEGSEPGDLRFNEILFDPWPDEYDFVEMVNISDRCLDASRLMLVSENPATGTLSASHNLSAEPRCILPGAYFTVTIDRELLLDRYFCSDGENVYEVNSLPSMPDDKANLFLYNRELDVIDSMSYEKDMHFVLLSGVEGVSLEKVNPSAQSWNRQNWHSAAGASGWGTPGTVNSVYTDTVPSGPGITLSGRRITPDSDGTDDLLTISFTSPSVENVLRVQVFSENGYPLRTIADNLTTGYEATFVWDGTDDNGALLPTGIYIVWVSAFDIAGNVSAWKRAVALLRR